MLREIPVNAKEMTVCIDRCPKHLSFLLIAVENRAIIYYNLTKIY